MEYVEHTFGPGETIRGIIRKLNHNQLDDVTFEKVLTEFKKINETKVPRIGDIFKIPVFDKKNLPPTPPRKKLVEKPRLVFNNPNPPPKKDVLTTENFEVHNFSLEGSRIETLDEENDYDERADLEAMEARQKRREVQRKIHKVKVEIPEEIKHSKKKPTPKPPAAPKAKKKEPEQRKIVTTTKKVAPIVKKEESITPKRQIRKAAASAPPEPVKREKKRLVNTSSISKHRRR